MLGYKDYKTRTALALFGLTGRSAQSSWVLKWLESLGEAVAQSISEPFSLPEPDFIMPAFACIDEKTHPGPASIHAGRVVAALGSASPLGASHFSMPQLRRGACIYAAQPKSGTLERFCPTPLARGVQTSARASPYQFGATVQPRRHNRKPLGASADSSRAHPRLATHSPAIQGRSASSLRATFPR